MPRFSGEIVTTLVKAFENDPRPPKASRLRVASETGLRVSQINKWFWERRRLGPPKYLVLTRDQRDSLMAVWNQYGPWPSAKIRRALAYKVDLPVEKVNHWFVYRRHRTKLVNLPKRGLSQDKMDALQEHLSHCQCSSGEQIRSLIEQLGLTKIEETPSLNVGNRIDTQQQQQQKRELEKQQEEESGLIIDHLSEDDEEEEFAVSSKSNDSDSIEGVHVVGSTVASFTSGEFFRQVNQSVREALSEFLGVITGHNLSVAGGLHEENQRMFATIRSQMVNLTCKINANQGQLRDLSREIRQQRTSDDNKRDSGEMSAQDSMKVNVGQSPYLVLIPSTSAPPTTVKSAQTFKST